MTNPNSPIDPFESKLKDKIQNYRSEFDGSAIWSGISGNLPKKNKNDRRFGIFLLGLLFVGITIFSSIFLQQLSYDEADAISLESSHANGSTQAVGHTKAIGHAQEVQPENSNTNDQSISVYSIPSDDAVKFKKELITNKSPKTLDVNTALLSSHASEQDSSFFKKNENTKIYSTLEGSVVQIDQKPLNEYFNVPLLEDKMSLTIEMSDELQIKPNDLLETINHKDWFSDIGIFTGAYFAHNTFTTVNGESSTWATTREQSETPVISTTNGLTLTIFNYDNFGIKSGFYLSNSYEKLNHSFISKSVNQKISTSNLTTPNGDSTITTTIFESVTNKRSVTHYNQRTYASIPIMAYYKNVNRGWIYGAQAGMAVNMPLRLEGRSITKDGKDIEYWSESQDIKYYDHTNLSYIGGLSIGKYIFPKWMISLEPTFIYYPNIINPNYNLRQKSIQAGGSISLIRELK